MANLFIAYDLISPGQNYEAVRSRIRELGDGASFSTRCSTSTGSWTPEAANSWIRTAMDANDKLVVVDASSGYISNYPLNLVDAINTAWFRPAA
jgi:hypothetical protein